HNPVGPSRSAFAMEFHLGLLAARALQSTRVEPPSLPAASLQPDRLSVLPALMSILPLLCRSLHLCQALVTRVLGSPRARSRPRPSSRSHTCAALASLCYSRSGGART